MKSAERVSEAEKALLGSMLRHNNAIGDAVLLLTADDFYCSGHQVIFASMVAIWDSGRKVDSITLADDLFRREKIDDIGGYPAIAKLLDCASIGGNIQSYAEIVKDASLLRLIGRAAQTISREAQNPSMKALDVLEMAEKEIFAIAETGAGGEVVDSSAVLGEALDRIDAATLRTATGIPTGFADIDELTGGLQQAELVVIAARPSVGKTAMALCIAKTVACAGIPVFVASLEQSRVELGSRLLCAQALVDGQAIRLGRLAPDQVRKLTAARDLLAQAHFFIDDKPCQTMLRIASTARRLRRRNKIGLMIIDYLQLIEPESRKESRQEQVSTICRRLKALAKELNIPVVALAQLNRAAEEGSRRRPRLNDLRESGGIEAAADTVWLLHRPEDDRRSDPEPIEVLIAKQRNGPTGDVALHYHRKFTLFESFVPPIPHFGAPRYGQTD